MDKENNIALACTALLMSVVKADGVIELKEIDTTKHIISKFFDLELEQVSQLIDKSLEALENASDMFCFGQIINNTFDHQKKLEFILNIYEIAYADKELHYLEQHIISKIANILHIEHADIIAAKMEIKKYL